MIDYSFNPIADGCNTDSRGDKFWYKNFQLHREDGPALEYKNGSKGWLINGLLHREDGPAIHRNNDTKDWFINGRLHREDGPAIEGLGSNRWYLNGEEIKVKTNEQFMRLMKLKAFL